MSVEIEISAGEGWLCESRIRGVKNALTTDVPAVNGGTGEFLSPTDVVGAAFGSCVLTMVRMAAAKAGADLGEVSAIVSKEMVSEPKRRIGSLKVSVRVPNWNKLPEDVQRRLEGAASSCPVKNSLNPDIAISVSFEY